MTKAVIDTNAIVKGFRLERFAEEAVTIPEVLAEVKDKQARHILSTLPFELKVKDPDDDAVKAVRRFARLTGDLGALSDPDIKVIALAYMLERDAHGVKHLRSEPPPLVLSKHKHNKASKQPGWDFVPNSDEWAELDAMNAEQEQAAAALERKLAEATLEAEAAEEASAAEARAKMIAAAAAKVVVTDSAAAAASEDGNQQQQQRVGALERECTSLRDQLTGATKSISEGKVKIQSLESQLATRTAELEAAQARLQASEGSAEEETKALHHVVGTHCILFCYAHAVGEIVVCAVRNSFLRFESFFKNRFHVFPPGTVKHLLQAV